MLSLHAPKVSSGNQMTGRQAQNRTRVMVDKGVLCVGGKLPGNADPTSVVIVIFPSEVSWDIL